MWRLSERYSETDSQNGPHK